jgi:hypothetical protein
MDMASSALPLSATFYNAQLTACHLQGRIENQWIWHHHQMISITTLWHIPQCTTHFLLAEQNGKLIWHHQHHHSLPHFKMHNSLPAIYSAEWRIIGHDISITTLWQISQCTTHILLFADQNP